MAISITRADFDKLENIQAINNRYFKKDKNYFPKRKRDEAKKLQRPIKKKLNELKNLLLDEAYFYNRFEITVSRIIKQTNQHLFGSVRNLVWISLVPLTELSKSKHNTYNHQRLPQLQISFKQDEFVVASIWLEGDGCEQQYRERFFEYIAQNKIDNRYKIKFHKKREKKAEFFDVHSKLKSVDVNHFIKNRSYSLGIEKSLSIRETVNLGNQIYTTIIDEIQSINEDIFVPCFKFQISHTTLNKVQSDKIKRKEKQKFDIKNSLRKGTAPTTVTKKHEEIQIILRDEFLKQYEGTGIKPKLEADFVDIKIEDRLKNSLILYEIKTDKSALNCLKSGLGQLLFYALQNKNENWRRIELVIIGLNKMTSEAKKFVKSIKAYLGEGNFRYQRFDETKKTLLSERQS